jgi:hypothetical protein
MNDLVHLVLALIAGVVTGTLLIGAWRARIRDAWSPRRSGPRGRH